MGLCFFLFVSLSVFSRLLILGLFGWEPRSGPWMWIVFFSPSLSICPFCSFFCCCHYFSSGRGEGDGPLSGPLSMVLTLCVYTSYMHGQINILIHSLGCLSNIRISHCLYRDCTVLFRSTLEFNHGLVYRDNHFLLLALARLFPHSPRRASVAVIPTCTRPALSGVINATNASCTLPICLRQEKIQKNKSSLYACGSGWWM